MVLTLPLASILAITLLLASRAWETVLGGAIGRSWGPCCELQQLWVHPAQRRQGIGGGLVRAFEDLGRCRGCSIFYLETFDFQAPALYRSLGYEVVHAHAVYPHGIVRYLMVRS